MLQDWLGTLLPWLLVFGLCAGFVWLVAAARRRRATAFVIGAFLQMLLPDPYAERTIEVVQNRKKEVIRKRDENGAPPDDTPISRQ
ncbi:MAG: hypothetical protein ACOY3E_13160 [Pseudomonadota bacterium]